MLALAWLYFPTLVLAVKDLVSTDCRVYFGENDLDYYALGAVAHFGPAAVGSSEEELAGAPGV